MLRYIRMVLSMIYVCCVLVFSQSAQPFVQEENIGSFVIKVFDKIGPLQCLKKCLHHKNCKETNYHKQNLQCQLYTKSNPDKSKDKSGFISFSPLSKPSLLKKDNCWPNPCHDKQHCISLHDQSHLCLLVDAPCSYNPCLNEGTCHVTGVQSYSCTCSLGFSGKYCQNTPCMSSPCKNNSTCEPFVEDYICRCHQGFYGKDCEFSNSCSPPRQCIYSDDFNCQCDKDCHEYEDCCSDQLQYCISP